MQPRMVVAIGGKANTVQFRQRLFRGPAVLRPKCPTDGHGHLLVSMFLVLILTLVSVFLHIGLGGGISRSVEVARLAVLWLRLAVLWLRQFCELNLD